METTKKTYTAPSILTIVLDNEISLAMESTPPSGPGEEASNNTSEYFNNDPFKMDLG